MRWYDRAIPKINDIMPYLKEAAKSISTNSQVKNVYAWGAVAENIANEESRVKDIDILIECNFDSGDLLAIDNSYEGALKIAKSELEDLGFNPSAVSFTQSLLKLKAPSIDFWAISKDKKLLHWGPITETIEEWKQVRKEAETRAEETTKLTKKEVLSACESDRKKWHQAYETYIQDYSNGCPQGWYASQNDVDKIFEKTTKIS
jgi:predicted nucleotidyltransferase